MAGLCPMLVAGPAQGAEPASASKAPAARGAVKLVTPQGRPLPGALAVMGGRVAGAHRPRACDRARGGVPGAARVGGLRVSEATADGLHPARAEVPARRAAARARALVRPPGDEQPRSRALPADHAAARRSASGGSGSCPLAEQFAEAYSWCARYTRIVSITPVLQLPLPADRAPASRIVQADQAGGAAIAAPSAPPPAPPVVTGPDPPPPAPPSIAPGVVPGDPDRDPGPAAAGGPRRAAARCPCRCRRSRRPRSTRSRLPPLGGARTGPDWHHLRRWTAQSPGAPRCCRVRCSPSSRSRWPRRCRASSSRTGAGSPGPGAWAALRAGRRCAAATAARVGAGRRRAVRAAEPRHGARGRALGGHAARADPVRRDGAAGSRRAGPAARGWVDRSRLAVSA